MQALDISSAPARAAVTDIALPVCFGESVMIWAEKAQIFRPIVPRIAVFMIHLQRNTTSSRIALTPTANVARFAA